jgi:hypothetical protein
LIDLKLAMLRLRLFGAADQSVNTPVDESNEDDWQKFLPDRRPNPKKS